MDPQAPSTAPPSCDAGNRPGSTAVGPSARAFLDRLGLSRDHPLCGGSEGGVANVATGVINMNLEGTTSFERGVFELPNATAARAMEENPAAFATDGPIRPPPIGPASPTELHDGSTHGLLLTATMMSAPALAMSELLLRFFAVFVAPPCLAWLLRREISSVVKFSSGGKAEEIMSKGQNRAMAVSILGMASSAVIFTDSLYVYEFGRFFGFGLFASSILLAFRCSLSMGDRGGRGLRGGLLRFAIVAFSALTTTVYLRSDGGRAVDVMVGNTLPSTAAAQKTKTSFEGVTHPGIDLPTIEPGLYYSKSNEFISSIVKNWPEEGRTYDVKNGATPFLVTGDQRTGIPFIMNKVDDQEYVQVWTRNEYDREPIALDIAFPYAEDGTGFFHDLSKPVYFILHGLLGGSHAEYVKDMVLRRRSEGSTCVVMIARGMMDAHMMGMNIFHGARTGDVDAAARAVRAGLERLAVESGGRRQLLAGIGYSIGAIILSNYVARSGKHCALDAAMAVSGGLDMRQNINFKRSTRLWQPMLTFRLREDMVVGKYSRHYKRRLTDEQFLRMFRVTSIYELDVEAIVTYNSFDNLLHYYSEMSAMGDRPPEFGLFGDQDETKGEGLVSQSWGRIANVSVPFAVLQSLDDPLVGWRTIGTNDPQGLANSGWGNTMLLLTKAGGHVGWPLGHDPRVEGWRWMSDVARDFVLAVEAARKGVAV